MTMDVINVAQHSGPPDQGNMELVAVKSEADTVVPANKLSDYLQQLSGQVDMVHSIDLDHSYALPNNWKPDNAYAKPIKTLFVTKKNAVLSSSVIDVVRRCDDDRRKLKPAYDEVQAKKNMGETEKALYAMLNDNDDPDWEYKLNRTQWTISQTKLFDRALRILSLDRLARLTQESSWNEPVLRRVTIDKSAKRFRTLLSTYSWKSQLVNWLHNTFVDYLEIPYLASYIDILQTLKKKVPVLVERMVSSVNYNSRRISPEMMNRLLKKPVDPASYGLPCYNPKRLPGNPLIVVVPSAPGTNTLQNSRVQRWFPYLSMIGHVTLVSTNNLLMTKATMTTAVDHMLAATRAKLAELRSDYAGRTIILVGFNTSAALACQVALLEQVTAVVCLGFPLNTVEDKRGQPDDCILNLTTPVLFIAGQHGPSASIDDLEDLRERLHVETGLVVVGSADDQLRVNKSKLSQEGITQSMVDRCIVDEIADFVGTILTAPPPPPQTSTPSGGRATPSKNEGRARMKFVERKRKLSGSDDSVLVTQPKKKEIIANPYKRSVGRPSTRGGRLKSMGGSDYQNPRKSTLSKEAQAAAASRQSEPLKVSDFDILVSDDGAGMLSDDNLMEQLTPDRLLEMPVIIAQEDASPPPPQIKMLMNRGGRAGRPTGVTKGRNLKTRGPVKIIVSKNSSRPPGSFKSDAFRFNNVSPRIKNFPATKNVGNVLDLM